MISQLARNAPPAEALDVNSDIFAFRAKRAAVKEAQNTAIPRPFNPSYVEEDRQIPMRDGFHITIRIHRPKQPPADGSPVFVVYHGGGFVFGDLDSEAVLCRQWTELGGVAVNVDYRLAPEHPFPGPVYDAFDALKWVRNLHLLVHNNIES
jgi:acetyl esterase/lipase